MTLRTFGLWLASVAVFVTPSRAHAQPGYPLAIKEHLQLSYAPPCSVCHAKGNAGGGTVTTPFGWALRSKGLDGEDEKTVALALDGVRSAHVDSDGDGTEDIDELVAATDPNSPGNVKLPNGEEPGYGCGASAPNPNDRAASLGFALPLLIGHLARRRSRTRRE